LQEKIVVRQSSKLGTTYLEVRKRRSQVIPPRKVMLHQLLKLPKILRTSVILTIQTMFLKAGSGGGQVNPEVVRVHFTTPRRGNRCMMIGRILLARIRT